MGCALTPELSRAAKRRRLGRIVRRDVKAEADLLQAGETTVMRGSLAASCEHHKGRESSRCDRSEDAAPAEQLEGESSATVPKLRMTTCDMRRAAHCPKECLNRSDETCVVHLHPKSMPLTRNAFSPRLTPELSRSALRPRRCDNLSNNSAAAKRSRLERIVRWLRFPY